MGEQSVCKGIVHGHSRTENFFFFLYVDGYQKCLLPVKKVPWTDEMKI